MKMISLNVKGLGDRAKRRRLRSLINNGKFDCVFLQETKCSVVNNRLIESFWGIGDFEWIARGANSLSGGLIIVWNSSLLNVHYHFSGPKFVGICASLKRTGLRCHLVNIYSSCSLDGKRHLSGDLLMTRRGFGGDAWCLVGDFNAVISRSERKGALSQSCLREISEFNQFISKMNVVDILVLGKKYTWFNADGTAMSG